MANKFSNGQAYTRDAYVQKYNTSRLNLLLVVVFTLINLVLLITNADRYFLFSAFIPYFIATIAMIYCGRLPDEFYTGEWAGMTYWDDSVFTVLIILSVVFTLFYLLAWFMSSKNRSGWLIFALVFFSLDTLGMFVLNGIALDSILDIIFHAWVIYYIALGIHANAKLKSLPKEVKVMPAPIAQPSGEETAGREVSAPKIADSPILREADNTVKYRVLLQIRVANYDICYRRVKHTNELVINGNVYGEYKAVMEFSHELTALYDGHRIVAGLKGFNSFIAIDGEIVSKQVRKY